MSEDICLSCGVLTLSDPNDKIEELVYAASIPNLATLFQRGKDAGLIKPSGEYGE